VISASHMQLTTDSSEKKNKQIITFSEDKAQFAEEERDVNGTKALLDCHIATVKHRQVSTRDSTQPKSPVRHYRTSVTAYQETLSEVDYFWRRNSRSKVPHS